MSKPILPETPREVLFLALFFRFNAFLFQNTGTTIQMGKFGQNCYFLIFIIEMQALVCNSLSPACFSSSALGSDGNSLRYLILNVHETRCTKKRNYLVI